MRKRNYNFNTSHCKGFTGFTFLEILITLSLIAILFLPMMRLFSHTLYSTTHSQDMITAANLAQRQMERIKNLAITKERIRALGNNIYPGENAPPFIVNGTSWQIKQIIKDSDPLEIEVQVCREGELDRPPIITLVTLIEDTIWIRPR